MVRDRGMLRADFTRITRARRVFFRMSADGFNGWAGVINVEEVSEPFIAKCSLGEKKVLDVGYIWVQLSPDDENWWLTSMFDERGVLLQYYFDIIEKRYISPEGEPRFIDMYIDVVMNPTGEYAVLDEDEIDAACARGEISDEARKRAYADCEKLIAKIKGNEPYFRGLLERAVKSL